MPIFDELLLKVAMQEKLTPSELESFRQEAKALNEAKEFVGKINKPGGIYLEKFRLGTGGINPDGTVLFPFVAAKSYHATDTNISDATFTTVTFNANQYGNNLAFRLDTDNQRIYILTKAKAFSATIAHAWEANAAGVRRADFQYFDVAGNNLGTALLSVIGGFAVEENWFTATRIADLPDTTEYIRCRVKQTSGGNLHLVSFSIDLHIV